MLQGPHGNMWIVILLDNRDPDNKQPVLGTFVIVPVSFNIEVAMASAAVAAVVSWLRSLQPRPTRVEKDY